MIHIAARKFAPGSPQPCPQDWSAVDEADHGEHRDCMLIRRTRRAPPGCRGHGGVQPDPDREPAVLLGGPVDFLQPGQRVYLGTGFSKRRTGPAMRRPTCRCSTWSCSHTGMATTSVGSRGRSWTAGGILVAMDDHQGSDMVALVAPHLAIRSTQRLHSAQLLSVGLPRRVSTSPAPRRGPGSWRGGRRVTLPTRPPLEHRQHGTSWVLREPLEGPTLRVQEAEMDGCRESWLPFGDLEEPEHAVSPLAVDGHRVGGVTGVRVEEPRRSLERQHLTQHKVLPDVCQLAEVTVRHRLKAGTPALRSLTLARGRRSSRSDHPPRIR